MNILVNMHAQSVSLQCEYYHTQSGLCQNALEGHCVISISRIVSASGFQSQSQLNLVDIAVIAFIL